MFGIWHDGRVGTNRVDGGTDTRTTLGNYQGSRTTAGDVAGRAEQTALLDHARGLPSLPAQPAATWVTGGGRKHPRGDSLSLLRRDAPREGPAVLQRVVDLSKTDFAAIAKGAGIFSICVEDSGQVGAFAHDRTSHRRRLGIALKPCRGRGRTESRLLHPELTTRGQLSLSRGYPAALQDVPAFELPRL